MEKQNELVSLSNRSGYVFLDGKLQQCKYIRTQYRFVKQDADTKERYYSHDHIVQLPNGDLYSPEDTEIFDTVEDYELNNPAKTSFKDARYAICDFCHKAGLYKRCKGAENIEFYTFYDGAPIHHRHNLTKFSWEYSDGETHLDEWKLQDNDIFPTDTPIYNDRDEAFQFNTYTVKNEDGTEEQRDGVCKLLMLDPDQRELLNQFEDIAKRLKKAGVMLTGNFCENYSAFNTRNVADITLMDSYSTSDAKNWEQGERCHMAFDVNLDLAIWSEDCDVYIKRKTNNKEEQQ